MAQMTLRQAIQTWQQRFEMTGLGLVEATLEHGPVRDGWCDSSLIRDTSIDVTLAHLSRRTSSQFAVELAYPWGREDGKAGALLGLLPEAGDESSEHWTCADAA